MKTQAYNPARRAILQASRSGPRGAPAATSSLPLHTYASQGLRRLARERKEVRARADWMSLLRRAGWAVPIYVPATAAALFWPYPVKKAMELRY